MVGKCKYRFSSLIVHRLLSNPSYLTLRLTWELISLGGLAVGAASREAGFHPQWLGLRGTSKGGGHVAYRTAAWKPIPAGPDNPSAWHPVALKTHTLKLYTIQQINKTSLPITHIKLIRFNFNFLYTRTSYNIPITGPNMEGKLFFIICWRVLWSETKQLLYHTVMKFVNMFLKFFNSPLTGLQSLQEVKTNTNLQNEASELYLTEMTRSKMDTMTS